MTKKWIAINLLLLLITGLLGWQLHISIDRFGVENDLAKIQPVRDMKQRVAEGVLPPLPPPKRYAAAEFAVVPEMNVFSEFRAREEKPVVAAVPETPPLAQKPVLVGVSLTGNQQLASILDPVSPPQGPGRRAQLKRIGDMYQGYVITDITMDHIVLESGTRREIIPLHEGSKRPQGGKTPILSTRVVSFGGGGTSGGSPVVVAGSAVAAKPAPASTVSIGQPASPANTPRPATQQGRQTPGNPPQPAAAPSGNIIRTPFGDIVRQGPANP